MRLVASESEVGGRGGECWYNTSNDTLWYLIGAYIHSFFPWKFSPYPTICSPLPPTSSYVRPFLNALPTNGREFPGHPTRPTSRRPALGLLYCPIIFPATPTPKLIACIFPVASIPSPASIKLLYRGSIAPVTLTSFST